MSLKKDIEQQVKELVSQDKLLEASRLLTSTYLEKEGYNLTSRLIHLSKKVRTGQLKYEDEIVERNQIRTAILDLVNSLEKSSFEKVNLNNRVNRKFLLYFLVALFSILPILYFMNFINDGNILKDSPESLFIYDSTYHILLLPFGPFASCEKEQLNYHISFQDRLNALNFEKGLGIEVKVYDKLDCNISYEQARTIGNQYRADLIIWGNYGSSCFWDSTLINVKYLTLQNSGMPPLQKSKMGGETGQITVHKMLGFNLLKEGQLTGRVEGLVFASLGIRSFFQQDYSEAIDYFNQVQVVDKSEFSQIFYFRGFSKLLSNKDSSQHLIFVDNINSLFTNEKVDTFLVPGKTYNAVRVFPGYMDVLQASKLDSNSAASWIIRADYYSFNAIPDSAEKYFSLAINNNPFDSYSLYRRGDVRCTLGKVKESISDYSKSISIVHDDPHVFHSRANMYFKVGLFDSALVDYQKAIQLMPKKIDFHFSIGNLYMRLNQFDSAINAYTKAIEILPIEANELFQEGKELESASRGRNFWNELTYFNRAISFYSLGQYDSAFVDFEKQ